MCPTEWTVFFWNNCPYFNVYSGNSSSNINSLAAVSAMVANAYGFNVFKIGRKIGVHNAAIYFFSMFLLFL